MNSGSFFRAEIARTTSSLSPGGNVSDSMSVTNPASYSRVISDSIELLIYPPQERGAADGRPANSLRASSLGSGRVGWLWDRWPGQPGRSTMSIKLVGFGGGGQCGEGEGDRETGHRETGHRETGHRD